MSQHTNDTQFGVLFFQHKGGWLVIAAVMSSTTHYIHGISSVLATSSDALVASSDALCYW